MLTSSSSLSSCANGDSNRHLKKKSTKQFVLFSLLIMFFKLCFSINFFFVFVLFFFFFTNGSWCGWLSSKVKINERNFAGFDGWRECSVSSMGHGWKWRRWKLVPLLSWLSWVGGATTMGDVDNGCRVCRRKEVG